MDKRFIIFFSIWFTMLSGVVNAQTVVEYIHTDALGTPVAVTNAAGQVIERSEYEPYGKLLNRPLTDGPGFTGHVQDAATGLTYMQQRYYDPIIGRFLSVDPVTAYGSGDMRHFNVYNYAYNNPYKFTDPDGRAGNESFNETMQWGDASYVRANTLNYEDAKTGLKVTAVVAGTIATEVATTKGLGLVTKGIAAYRAYKAAQSTSRVGRWMSKSERVKMERTGRVQESTSGTTHVADPANPETFGRQATAGSEYVEFNVPTSSLKPTSEGGVSKVIGPNSTEGRLAAKKGEPVPQMPKCTDVKVCGGK